MTDNVWLLTPFAVCSMERALKEAQKGLLEAQLSVTREERDAVTDKVVTSIISQLASLAAQSTSCDTSLPAPAAAPLVPPSSRHALCRTQLSIHAQLQPPASCETPHAHLVACQAHPLSRSCRVLAAQRRHPSSSSCQAQVLAPHCASSWAARPCTQYIWHSRYMVRTPLR